MRSCLCRTDRVPRSEIEAVCGQPIFRSAVSDVTAQRERGERHERDVTFCAQRQPAAITLIKVGGRRWRTASSERPGRRRIRLDPQRSNSNPKPKGQCS